jgi:hypothetical protein
LQFVVEVAGASTRKQPLLAIANLKAIEMAAQ